MPLPETVLVKLSTEAAESISLTPVVVREMPVRELVEHILGHTGKDLARLHQLLLRGGLVIGATRFRWEGWAADDDSLRALLATFPDPDPNRVFDPQQCVRAVLRGGRQPIEIPRQAGSSKRLLRKTSFWDVLIEVVKAGEIRYCGYSYKDKADVYQAAVSSEAAKCLREGCRALKYSALRERIRMVTFDWVELYASR